MSFPGGLRPRFSMTKFIRGNLSEYDFSEWTALEVERFEQTPVLAKPGPKPNEALEHVILIIDREYLLDDVRD